MFGIFKYRRPLLVQPFYGYRNAETLFLPVRALRGKEPAFNESGALKSFRTMLGQYASHEVEGLEIDLEFETGSGDVIRRNAVTNAEGFAHFDIYFDDKQDLPLQSGWDRARLSWSAQGATIPAGETEAFVLAPGREAGIGVISDIDDTILETGITGSARAILRNWKRVMIQMPGQRSAVPGAHGFYEALGGQPIAYGRDGSPRAASVPQARPRPVFYVSSSPWNLFAYLVAYKLDREMPLGPVMLRDWGFNRKTLGSKGHGSHKQDAIERILATYPHLRFVLVGDDTQKDLVAFGAVAAKSPDRIAAIFIRQAAGEALSEKEISAKTGIEKAGVPLWMGENYSTAHEFLSGAGLELDAPLKTLVETASEGTKPPVAEDAKAAR
ncbi:phosphatase domain-containing protein [Erythrobacter sp. MTPC3]|uniref:phosphatase domain-containing protein n=1 Tax=Erythrobacter sp. MTPC3 TaxID=3056564 RepID=UPI0036F37A7E